MHRVLYLCFSLVLVAITSSAQAEPAGQIDPKAVARLQLMVRQLSTEREALAAENAKLKSEVEDVRKKFGDLRTKAQSALTQFKEQSNDLGEKLRENQARVLELETVNTRQAEEFNTCMKKNVALYDSHRDILRQYEKKGVFASLLQREPLTGIKQVEIENLIEDYRERIDPLQVKIPSPAAKAEIAPEDAVSKN